MATISDARAIYGLAATGTPTSTGVSGSVQIGTSQTQSRFSTADVAYSVRAIICTITDDFILTIADGTTTGSTAFVQGAAQVETATAAGTIGTTGNATVVVTAAGMTGSPKTVSVAVTSGDTAATWAGKVRTALAADADIAAKFTVGGTTTAITLTRLHTHSFTVPTGTLYAYAANDATLNISLDNGTCSGITTAATSANTTAGVISSGVKIYDGDGKDFEGTTIQTMTLIYGVLIENSSGSDSVLDFSGPIDGNLNPGGTLLSVDPVGHVTDPITFGSDGSPVDVKVTIIGQTA